MAEAAHETISGEKPKNVEDEEFVVKTIPFKSDGGHFLARDIDVVKVTHPGHPNQPMFGLQEPISKVIMPLTLINLDYSLPITAQPPIVQLLAADVRAMANPPRDTDNVHPCNYVAPLRQSTADHVQYSVNRSLVIWNFVMSMMVSFNGIITRCFPYFCSTTKHGKGGFAERNYWPPLTDTYHWITPTDTWETLNEKLKENSIGDLPLFQRTMMAPLLTAIQHKCAQYLETPLIILPSFASLQHFSGEGLLNVLKNPEDAEETLLVSTENKAIKVTGGFGNGDTIVYNCIYYAKKGRPIRKNGAVAFAVIQFPCVAKWLHYAVSELGVSLTKQLYDGILKDMIMTLFGNELMAIKVARMPRPMAMDTQQLIQLLETEAQFMPGTDARKKRKEKSGGQDKMVEVTPVVAGNDSNFDVVKPPE